MHTPQEERYLIKAVDVFQKKFIVVSPRFEILAASARIKAAYGTEIIGLQCHEVLNDRLEPCENCAIIEARESGKPELRIQTKDKLLNGALLPCYYAYPIYDGDRIEAFVGMDLAIPDISALQEKLEKSNSFLKNLIFSAVDGVIAADKKGNLIIFNEAASQVFGYAEDEALSDLNIRDIYPKDVAYEVMRQLRSTENGGRGKLRQYKVQVLNKEKEIIPINLNASIIYEGEKEIATIGFFHDLREEIRIKECLDKAQIQLMQAEKMSSLGKLSAGVAHQLNNPLGGITLFAKLMLEEYQLEEAARQDLNRILKDAERCRDTVRELLEFSRQTKYFMQPHDINDAIRRTLFLLENQSIFQNIDIEKDLYDGPVLIDSDIQQMNHLIMNIVLNAAQAMEGKGTLTIRTVVDENEGAARMIFSDTGPGIAPEDKPMIFDPFFTTKQEGEGTGLGLSLVYGIVENHAGAITVESTPGMGATFIIRLPLSK